jgi:hypothetical protein
MDACLLRDVIVLTAAKAFFAPNGLVPPHAIAVHWQSGFGLPFGLADCRCLQRSIVTDMIQGEGFRL